MVVLDRIPERLALAKRFGADHALDIDEFETPERRIEAVNDLTGGGGHVVAELVGRPAALAEGIRMVRAEGRYLVVGNISTRHTIEFNPAWLVHLNRRMIGVGGYQSWALRRGLELLERTRDRYPWGEILSHTWPLESINEAFEHADRGGANPHRPGLCPGPCHPLSGPAASCPDRTVRPRLTARTNESRMEYNVRSTAFADVVEVSGRIAASESVDFARRLEAHLASDPVRAIVLDLSRVDYMSSAGLGTVLWLGQRLREAKSGFAVFGLRDRVAQVFKLSGLDRILPIYPDLAAAEAAIEKGESGGGATAGR